MIQKCHASTATLILVNNHFYNFITDARLCLLNHLKLLCNFVHVPLELFQGSYTSCQELACSTNACVDGTGLSIKPKTIATATATATATTTTMATATRIRRKCAR